MNTTQGVEAQFTSAFKRLRAEVIEPAFKLAQSPWIQRGFESSLRYDESPPAMTLEFWLSPRAISSLSFVGRPETELIVVNRGFGDRSESRSKYRLSQFSDEAVQNEIDEFLESLVGLQEQTKSD
jgi:hypothetical protein